MIRILFLLIVLTLCPGPSGFAAPDKMEATLVIQALGEIGQQSDVQVQIYAPNTQMPAATTTVGTPVRLPAGTYRVEVEILGGKVTRNNVLTKTGRTSTVIINEVAGLQVSALDKKGNDLGLGVEIYDGVSGEKLGETLSGELLFAYPGVVDVKVATPPQAHWWRQIELRSGGVQQIEIRERVQGELVVLPLLNGHDASPTSQVVIYEAGTQKEVARSEPGREHRFALDAGRYDIFVANQAGQGKPFVMGRAEVKGEERVETSVPLDGQRGDGGRPGSPPKTQEL